MSWEIAQWVADRDEVNEVVGSAITSPANRPWYNLRVLEHSDGDTCCRSWHSRWDCSLYQWVCICGNGKFRSLITDSLLIILFSVHSCRLLAQCPQMHSSSRCLRTLNTTAIWHVSLYSSQLMDQLHCEAEDVLAYYGSISKDPSSCPSVADPLQPQNNGHPTHSHSLLVQRRPPELGVTKSLCFHIQPHKSRERRQESLGAICVLGKDAKNASLLRPP